MDLLVKQGGTRALRGCELAVEEAVLDHCHFRSELATERVNSLQGKVENNAPRYAVEVDQLVGFLQGAGSYMPLHSTEQTGLVHPRWFSPEKKVERRKAER